MSRTRLEKSLLTTDNDSVASVYLTPCPDLVSILRSVAPRDKGALHLGALHISCLFSGLFYNSRRIGRGRGRAQFCLLIGNIAKHPPRKSNDVYYFFFFLNMYLGFVRVMGHACRCSFFWWGSAFFTSIMLSYYFTLL